MRSAINMAWWGVVLLACTGPITSASASPTGGQALSGAITAVGAEIGGDHHVVRRQTSTLVNISIDATTTSSAIAAIVAGHTATSVGSITISSAIITGAQLDTLLQSVVTVQGDIRLTNLVVGSISMPALTTAGSLYISSCQSVTTLGFGALTSVTGTMTLRLMYMLSGSAVSNSFPNLQTISGELYIYLISWSGLEARSAIVFPAIQSVGSLYVRQSNANRLSCPLLTTVSGRFYFYYFSYLRSLDMPSLSTVTGQITISTAASLNTLCSLGLTPSGYQSTQTITLSSVPNLVQMPQWIATNASLAQTTTECSGLPAIVISTAAAYAAFAQNTALTSATVLGEVVISWPAITNAQLATVLQGKTELGALVIEGCPSITTLTAAVASLSHVRTGLVLDRLTSLTTVEFPALVTVGGMTQIMSANSITSISMPLLQNVGSFSLQYLYYLNTASFGSLTTVNGTLYLRQLYRLSGTALSGSFPNLQTVSGELYIYYISWYGAAARSPLTLPMLQSVGSMHVRTSYTTRFSCPVLTTVGGRFYWYYMPTLRSIDMPSLSTVTGRMTVSTAGALANLCSLGLTPSGYQSTQTITLTSVPNLVHTPQWIATNASLAQTTTECTGLPAIVISTAAAYTAFAQNTALTSATVLGEVVISWPAITNAQLVTVLQGKTELGALVIEGCTNITDLTTAVASLQNVTTGLVLDRLTLLTSANFPALVAVGGGIQVLSMTNLITLAMPSLVTARSIDLSYMYYLTTLSFGSLTAVNGSMTLRQLYRLTGTAASGSFPNLQTIGGELYIYLISWSGAGARSSLTLPMLQSVGSMYVRQTYTTRFSCPVLTTVSGRFYWYYMLSLRSIDMPSLSTVVGRMTVSTAGALANLCSLGLTPSGYQSTQTITLTSVPSLVHTPQWIATNASLAQTTTECSGLPVIVISTAAAYAAFLQNTTLTSATVLGEVVISWPAITNAQLVTVLQGKTELGALVIEGCTNITDLTTAVASLQNVTTGLVLDRLTSLTSANFPALVAVGGGIQVLSMTNLITLAMPSLVTAGNIDLSYMYYLTTLSFGSLTAVNGSVTLRQLYRLSGTAASGSFPNLQTISGELYIYLISWYGTGARTPVVLPQLRSVGSMHVRQTYTTTFSCPALTTVSGRFYWYYMPALRSLDFPALAAVTGRFSVINANTLGSLCQIGLNASGYSSTLPILLSGVNLVQSPPWMSTSASLTSVSACSGLPVVTIATVSDFDAFRQTPALVNAVELGSVVITWPAINNAQLATVLQGKTTLGELVIEGCTLVTSLRPAIDNLTSVAGGLTLNNLNSLLYLELPQLQSVGRGLRIYSNTRLTSISAVALQSAGSVYLYNCRYVRTLTLTSLTAVNGSVTMSVLYALNSNTVLMPNLRTVSGVLYMYLISWNGATPRSVLSLPNLESVGDLQLSRTYTTTLLVPVLSQTGDFLISSLTNLRSLQAPSLATVSGRFSVTGVPALGSLCGISLPRSGFAGTVQLSTTTNFAEVPQWIATNASLQGTTACSGLPSVIIQTANDFLLFQQNASLVSASALQTVIVTWASITNSQLLIVLRGKVTIGTLVLEGLRSITSLRPALDTLVTVRSGLVIDNLPALSSISLVALTSIGGGLQIFTMPYLGTVSMPQLAAVGSFSIVTANALQRASFPLLTTVTSDLSIQFTYLLTGSAITNAFPALATIGGELYMRLISWSGSGAQSVLLLPQLQTVGSLFLQQTKLTAMTFPALTAVGTPTVPGRMYIRLQSDLRGINAPLLGSISGPVTLLSLTILSNLCGMPNVQPGQSWAITQSPNLIQMPGFIAANATLSETADCSGAPAVVIHTAADLAAFQGNASLLGASELGPVIITYPDITNAQLASVLGGKTTLGGLVIEGCTSLTSLSPAIDTITTITSGLTIDRLVVTTLHFPVLASVGGGVQIFTMSRLTDLGFPTLVTTSSLFLYNSRVLTTSSFGSLTSVNGTFSLKYMYALSGSAISNGFPNLQTVGGEFYMYLTSRSAASTRSTMTLPQLQSVGSVYIVYSYITHASFPVLSNVGSVNSTVARFYWSQMPYLRSLHAPSLQSLYGPMTLYNVPGLSNLCHFGLMQAGYHSAAPIAVFRVSTLVSAPTWVATSVGFTNLTVCSGAPAVIIDSAAAYQSFLQTSQSVSVLGNVIITWGAILNAQLSQVLAGKTVLGGLVIEGCASLTDVSTAFANITTIQSSLVLDGLDSLLVAAMPALVSVAGRIEIFTMPRLMGFEAPALQSSGALLVYNNRYLQRLFMPALAVINGSMTLSYSYSLSAAAISDGFVGLVTVEDQLVMYYMSWSGGTQRSVLSLPMLATVGSWSMQRSYVTAVAAPALTHVGSVGHIGTFLWATLPSLRSLHFPSLVLVGGPITISAVPQLSNLCQLGLQRSGYLSNQRVQISGAPHLSKAPAWVISVAALTGSLACSGDPILVVHSQSDYTAIVQNATLMAATSVGPVVITWPQITDTELTTLMRSRTSTEGLVIEGCRSVSTLTPALDSLTSIGAGLVIDNVVALSAIDLPALQSVGSIMQIYNIPNLFQLSMVRLTEVGGSMYLYSLPQLGTALFTSLQRVNGSLTITSTTSLSGSSITTGFSALETVQDELGFNTFSRTGTSARSPVTLLRLASVGSWNVRTSYITGFAAPLLTIVGGQGQTGTFAWTSLPYVSNLIFPRLATVVGQFTVSALTRLSTLCGIGLPRSGYLSRQQVHIVGSAAIVYSPSWIAAISGIAGTSVCLTSSPTSSSPTDIPTAPPTAAPTIMPTTTAPTDVPTTLAPTSVPTGSPTSVPTSVPSFSPSATPTGAPTGQPTSIPTATPTAGPSRVPSAQPTATPSTAAPTDTPTAFPTCAINNNGNNGNGNNGNGNGNNNIIIRNNNSGGSTGSRPLLGGSDSQGIWCVLPWILFIVSIFVNMMMWKRMRALAKPAPKELDTSNPTAFLNPMYCGGNPSGAHAESGYAEVKALGVDDSIFPNNRSVAAVNTTYQTVAEADRSAVANPCFEYDSANDVDGIYSNARDMFQSQAHESGYMEEMCAESIDEYMVPAVDDTGYMELPAVAVGDDVFDDMESGTPAVDTGYMELPAAADVFDDMESATPADDTGYMELPAVGDDVGYMERPAVSSD